MAIIRHPLITERTHVSVLPPNWGTLYEVTKLLDDVFEALISDRAIFRLDHFSESGSVILTSGYCEEKDHIDLSNKTFSECEGHRLRDLRDLTPEGYARIVAQWRAAGAQIVGGCCGVGPAHIARLSEELDRPDPIDPESGPR